MTTVKKLSGDYLITNKDNSADVTISTRTLYIDGNLQVGGNATSITVTDTDVTDNTITLNKGETGPGVTGMSGNAGIRVDRGPGQFYPELHWDESTLAWMATEDGTIYKYILTGTSPGGLVYVKDDPAPELGGNLNITGRSLFSTTANVVFYANTVNGMGGDVGVYVNDLDGTNEQELISKRRALTFSILFG